MLPITLLFLDSEGILASSLRFSGTGTSSIMIPLLPENLKALRCTRSTMPCRSDSEPIGICMAELMSMSGQPVPGPAIEKCHPSLAQDPECLGDCVPELQSS
eukprot:scaffold9917_cov38-Prasinocladus_malaysianus.AAC.1